MRMSAVDFHAPEFTDHPDGWQSPADLMEGFLLAWAIEMRERRRIDPHNPFGRHVLGLLPPMFRYDTLGQLVRTPLWAHASSGGPTTRGRLTSLCIVWRLFEELNTQWRLVRGDFSQYASALSLATGGTDRKSVFRDLSADLAKCLLSDRIERAYAGAEDLTAGEQWFITGDGELLRPHSHGHEAIPFSIGGSYVPIILVSDSFVLSIWSAARVLVELRTPEFYISKYDHRSETLIEILDKGASRAEQRQHLSRMEALTFDPWPGWPGSADSLELAGDG